VLSNDGFQNGFVFNVEHKTIKGFLPVIDVLKLVDVVYIPLLFSKRKCPHAPSAQHRYEISGF